jgi:gamma-glutamyltranspeptidase/glutathione hydrolase
LRATVAAAAATAVLLFGARLSPAAVGTRGMVASEHALASEAGVEILQAGGNAVDAAVATAFAVCVVNPSSCGIGGGGFMLIHVAEQGRTVALDYRETAPAAASPDMFVRDGIAVSELSLRDGLAVAVPGEVAGLTAVLARHGTLSLENVLAPAIRYAGEGFAVGDHLAHQIARSLETMRTRPALASIFLHADGTPVRVGEKLRQPELAETLRRIAAEGAPAYYSGDIADRIVRSVRAAGGILTRNDLANYRPRWRAPLRQHFGAYEILTMPLPSSAGILLQILGMLRHDDLASLGPNSPTYAHLLAEAMKHAFADRAQFYGDADHVSVPLAALLAPQNTARLRQRISAVRTHDNDSYGSSWQSGVHVDDAGTSHLSVIDDRGNAVACTTTINTPFGSMVVAERTGIVLNNEMDDFSAQPGVANVYGLVGSQANAVAAGKRPLSSMSPTLATRDGRAVLAVGGSGGPRIISATLQVLLNALVFDMDAAAAVGAPRLHAQWMPPVVAVESDFPEATAGALRRRGHDLRAVGPLAAVQMARRRGNGFEGAADPRKGGKASGWSP